jgi:hypothetical protein
VNRIAGYSVPILDIRKRWVDIHADVGKCIANTMVICIGSRTLMPDPVRFVHDLAMIAIRLIDINNSAS